LTGGQGRHRRAPLSYTMAINLMIDDLALWITLAGIQFEQVA
jgi:hypothetical protein